MTPPDDSGQDTPSGQNESDDGSSFPPWQRVARDTSSGDAEGFGDRWSAGELPTSDGATSENTQRETQTISPGAGAETSFIGAAGSPQSDTPPDDVSALRRRGRGPRRASLQVRRFDPWSVLKLSLVLGVALFFVWLVAVGVLYTVLEGMGVWDKLNGTYDSLVEDDSPDDNGGPFITAGRVFGVAAIVGAINIVLISALTTVAAFIYNVSAGLSGGLEVTLSERE